MNTLILYYSRTGTTEKAARSVAKSLGADLLEIRSDRYPQGLRGYLRAFMDAGRSHEVPFEAYEADLSRYDLVIIATPIWNTSISAPIRSYLIKNARQIRRVAFVATCGGAGTQHAFHQLRQICGKEPIATLDLRATEVGQRVSLPKIERFAAELRKSGILGAA